MRTGLKDLEPRNIMNFAVNGDAPDPSPALDPSAVRALATRLFTECDGALVQLLGGPLAPVATLLLIKYAKEAVHELLDQQRDAVVRSCGGPITKDLALGTLLGDALGIELLQEEASQVGKAAAVQAGSREKIPRIHRWQRTF